MTKFSFFDVYDFGGHITVVEADSSSPFVYFSSKLLVYVIILGIIYTFSPIILALVYLKYILGTEYRFRKELKDVYSTTLIDGYQVNLLTFLFSLGYFLDYIYGGFGLYFTIAFFGKDLAPLFFNANILIGLYHLVILFFRHIIFDDTKNNVSSNSSHYIIVLLILLLISYMLLPMGEIISINRYEGFDEQFVGDSIMTAFFNIFRALFS